MDGDDDVDVDVNVGFGCECGRGVDGEHAAHVGVDGVDDVCWLLTLWLILKLMLTPTLRCAIMSILT